MDFNAAVLISFVSLLLVARESSAIRCYSCGSSVALDKSCEDPFNSNGVSYVQCANSCTKIKGKNDHIQLVIRDCSPTKLKDACVVENRSGVKVHVCACNSDKCNLATTATFSMATTLAAAIGGILYYFI